LASFNRVILMGNLTRDPELRYIQSGTAVTDVGLAVNDRRKTATGEWVEEVTFVDVTVWGRQAETVSEYLTKGSPVLFEGRLKLDTWEKDGQKHSKLKVICERMQMLGGRSGQGGPGGDRPQGGDRNQGGGRPAQRSGGSQPNQAGPPEYVDDIAPQEMSGGDGGGDDIPF
jgi:single-strand DNA-binding protein